MDKVDTLKDQVDSIKEQVEAFVASVPPRVAELSDYFKNQFPSDFETYINQLKTINKDELIQDFSQLKITPVTATISVVGVTTLLVFSKLLFSGKSTPATTTTSKKSKKKKVSKAQKSNKQIQAVLDDIETTWVPQINEYFESYKTLKPQAIEYKFNYFQEMLLKELIKLDDIDVLGNDTIRENRKKVIQFVQDHQKRLDAFKREIEL